MSLISASEEFSNRYLYEVYSVKIQFREHVYGGTPKNPALLKGFVAAKTEHNDEQTEEQVTLIRESLKGQETDEKSWNGFPTTLDKGLFIWSRQIKAMFRESATMLRITTEKRGSKQILQHGFEIKNPIDGGQRHYLDRFLPDGTFIGPINVMTPQGPRAAIKQTDYCERASLEFEIWVLKTEAKETRHVGKAEIIKMLTFAQENGLGAERSQGHGKFDVIEFSKSE